MTLWNVVTSSDLFAGIGVGRPGVVAHHIINVTAFAAALKSHLLLDLAFSPFPRLLGPRSPTNRGILHTLIAHTVIAHSIVSDPIIFYSIVSDPIISDPIISDPIISHSIVTRPT